MNLIVTHRSADFDALASLVLAGKIFPDSVLLLPTLSSPVYSFFSIYGTLFENIKPKKKIDLDKIDKVIVVDTQYPDRLGSIGDFVKDFPKVVVIDHHELDSSVLPQAKKIIKIVGATTSIITHMLKNKKIELNSIEASLGALGIYEDTGNLTFLTTKKYDMEALSYLFNFGVDLTMVSKYAMTYMNVIQKKAFEKLLFALKIKTINGYRVGISEVVLEEYVEGMGFLTHKLLELFDLSAVFIILKSIEKRRAVIIARSKTVEVDVRKILSPYGGAGHKTASSANFEIDKDEILIDKIVKLVEENTSKRILAKDIMSSPVKTISEKSTLDEARKIMLRYGFSALPVVKKEKIIGMLLRKDLERMELHGLTNLKVKDFMKKSIVIVSPEIPLEEIEKIMIEGNVGRIPVVVKGKIVGIIARSDILRAIYPEINKVIFPVEKDYVIDLLERNVPSRIAKRFKEIGKIAEGLNMKAYLVGGFVRDLLLKRKVEDIDIVVEGDAIILARKVKEEFKAKIFIHPDFKTAKVVFDDGVKIDIASSRREYYKEPAALPKIEWASLKEDLARRDFTINTLAISLNPNEFGLLIDLFGGIKDLKERRIKVLHNFSFIEDPTRILRAIRYATKLGFIIDNDTINLMRNTIKTGLFTDSRNTRMKEEFFTILRDKTITIPALRILKSLDGFKFIHRKLKYNEETEELIKKAERLMRRMEKEEILFERDKIILFLLISELNDFERKEVIKRWSMKENFINKESYYSDEQNELKETEEVYSIYRILEPLSLEEIVYLYTKGDKETKNKIEKYLFELRKRKLHIGGKDLLKLGMKPSPEFSRILRIVKRYVIEGKLKTKKDELNFVKTLLEKGERHVFEKTT